jgi:hypothetical protein
MSGDCGDEPLGAERQKRGVGGSAGVRYRSGERVLGFTRMRAVRPRAPGTNGGRVPPTGFEPVISTLKG